MYQINLSKIPHQTVRVKLDNDYFKVTVKTIEENITVFSVSCNDIELIQNVRVLNKKLLIPQYLQKGNFVFVSDNQEVNYKDFAENCILYYLSNKELKSA